MCSPYASEVVEYVLQHSDERARSAIIPPNRSRRSMAMIVPATANPVTVRNIFRFNFYLRRPALAFFAFLTAGFLFFFAPP
jgi:hypothetical protein